MPKATFNELELRVGSREIYLTARGENNDRRDVAVIPRVTGHSARFELADLQDAYGTIDAHVDEIDDAELGAGDGDVDDDSPTHTAQMTAKDAIKALRSGELDLSLEGEDRVTVLEAASGEQIAGGSQ